MKKLFSLIISSCFIFMLLYNNARSETSAEIAKSKSLFDSKCSLCHSTSRPLYTNKTKDGWTATVKRMQSKKPDHINDAEADEIIAYLFNVRGLTVNKIKDPSSITESEKVHIPVIQIISEDKEKKTMTITVKVGDIQHPMEEKHHIKNIELFVDEKPVGKIRFKPGDKPEAKFEISVTDNKKITARANCIIHGIWEAENK